MNTARTVLFIANMFPDDFSRGVTKKVFAQIEALENLGFDVENYTGYAGNGAKIYNRSGEVVYEKKFIIESKLLFRIFKNRVLKKVVADYLKETGTRYEISYIRYFFFDAKAKEMLKEAKHASHEVYLEMHSYPNYNKDQYALYPVFLLDRIFRSGCIKYVDKIVAVSKEKNIFGKKTFNIDNGIDLRHIAPQVKIKGKPNQLRIISVSYEWEAHGYDRILKGLRKYIDESAYTIEVSIVFVGTIMNKTKKLIDDLKLNSFVSYVGIQIGNELDSYYNKADIGMGQLGAHRCNSEYSSGLKTKEYIAKGIPFFHSGKPFYDEEFPYALQLPSNDDPINIEDIVDFYKAISTDPCIVEKMRKWAENYTWEAEFRKVFFAD